MVENGFYKIKPEFFNLINRLGGKYSDRKDRPVFCCIEDKHIESLYWAIPTSDISHRSPAQISKIQSWCNESGIRSAYYHIGYTNRPALYKISNCFPITNKYVDTAYTSQGCPLVLKNKREIEIIRTKLHRILFDESIHPDKYEQHITSIQNFLISEIRKTELEKDEGAHLLTQEKTPYNDLLVKITQTNAPIHKTKSNDPDR